MKWIMTISAILIGLFASILTYVHHASFSESAPTDQALQDFLSSHNTTSIRFSINHTFPGNLHFAFLPAAKTAKYTVVFIHGSPGHWANYIEYFKQPEIHEVANILVVDRPGYGGSDAGVAIGALREQARRIHAALSLEKIDTPIIVVGHSLGGPIAVHFALDHPDKVSGLILLAPSLSPKLEELKWYNQVMSVGLVQGVMPQPLVTSNSEIISHKQELRELEKQLSELTVPTIIMHGTEDSLVPPENLTYFESKVPEGLLIKSWRLEQTDHFIPWTRRDKVVEAIQLFIR